MKFIFSGSPFTLDIADASSVNVYGENLRSASLGKTAHFLVHALGAEAKDISAHVTGTRVSPTTTLHVVCFKISLFYLSLHVIACFFPKLFEKFLSKNKSGVHSVRVQVSTINVLESVLFMLWVCFSFNLFRFSTFLNFKLGSSTFRSQIPSQDCHVR